MSPLLILLIIVGVLVTIGVIVAGVMLSRGNDSTTQERLRSLGEDPNALSADDEQRDGEGQKQGSILTRQLNRVIEDRGLGRNIAIELARADLKLTVAEFFALTVISIVGFAALAWLIYGNFVLVLIGVVAGYFAPKIFVKFRQRSRLKAFNNQVGDAIQLMANGLRAGYSMLQAMDALAREMPPPISLEFRRLVQEIGLGINSERAFNNLLRRVPSDDLDLMITAINVQSEVGGNLAEILEIIGEVIRERVRIKGEIQVLTAQGQLSGYVISALPIVLGLLLYAMNQKYIGRMIFPCPEEQELCSQPCGWIMIIAGIITISAGFFAIQKIIDIDV
jgi:tight adherence protein B